MSKCENCEQEHNERYGSGRFCCSKCAKGFSTKAKRKEINRKLSKYNKELLKGGKRIGFCSPIKKAILKTCAECDKTFETKKEDQLCCSISCASKYRWKDFEYKNNISEKMSKIATLRHLDNNSNFGWQTREKFEASYPEKLAHIFLIDNKIDFLTEYKVGKYFIDIAIIEKKIAIEIDGQQHEKPERKESDKKKDIILKQKGWKVFRVKYPKENIIDSIKNICVNLNLLDFRT